MNTELLTISNLKIGDVVKFAGPNGTSPITLQPFNELTVIQITKENVTFFRLYVHLGNFIHTGGVTPYLGTERFDVPTQSKGNYLLLGNVYRGEN